jgi:hypothetical protein
LAFLSLSIYFVVADSAVLIPDLRVKSALFERLVGAGTRPPVGNLLDLSLSGGPHDLLPEGKALLAFDLLQSFAFQVGMRREDSVRGVGAEHVEITVLEAALTLVEHVERFPLVLLHGSNRSFKHGLGFFGTAKLPCLRWRRDK